MYPDCTETKHSLRIKNETMKLPYCRPSGKRRAIACLHALKSTFGSTFYSEPCPFCSIHVQPCTVCTYSATAVRKSAKHANTTTGSNRPQACACAIVSPWCVAVNKDFMQIVKQVAAVYIVSIRVWEYTSSLSSAWFKKKNRKQVWRCVSGRLRP